MNSVLPVPLLIGLFLVAGCAPWTAGAKRPAQHNTDARDVVVLVHGMGRTPLSMLPLGRALERDGYRVINWGYSSLCCSVAELGTKLQKHIDARRGAAEHIHFVGHSLGNIIVRWALTQGDPPVGAGRIVMLAPPNQGSRDAHRYEPWFGWLLKPMKELTTDSLSSARTIPVPGRVAIGVIAGQRDGKVSVSQTHLRGQADHRSVPSGHTFIMMRSDVRRLTLTFLRHGRFDAP